MKSRSTSRNLVGTAAAPVFVALISLAITTLGWVAAFHYIADRDEERFHNAIDNFEGTIRSRIELQVGVLQATKAMVQLEPSLSREQFRSFVDALEVNRAYPGATGIGWSEFLAPPDVEGFMRRQQGYRVIRPSSVRGEIHAVFAVEPEANLRAAPWGVNLYEDPVRAAAIDLARTSGEPVMTDLVLPISGSGEPSFVLIDPVYVTPTAPPKADRNRLFRGFVYSPFEANRFLHEIFADRRSAEVRVVIFSGPEIDPAKYLATVPSSPAWEESAFHRVDTVRNAGQQWTLVFESTPYFEDSSSKGLLIWIPIIGVLISALLTLLSYRQAQAAEAIAGQADQLQQRVSQLQVVAQTGDVVDNWLDYDRMLGALAQVAVPNFADFCFVDIHHDGILRRVSSAHHTVEGKRILEELHARYPERPSDGSIQARVLDTGVSIHLVHIEDELLQGMARSDDHLRLLRALACRSATVVPIQARGRTFGAISFGRSINTRNYDETDLALAGEIARRAGIAIENSLLYQEARRERQEVRRLNDHLESIVRERTVELERSNRELEAFSYSVSHDLRGPLRSVDGFARALLDEYGGLLDETGKGYVGRVRAAARRMDELITSLLKLSRITRATIAWEPVDFSAVAEDVAEDLRATTQVPVEIVVQPDLHTMGDGKMLHVMLHNLMGNAVKFSSKSERPRVEVGQQGGAFFVRDNGVGFNPEYSNKLFIPFERLHSNDQFAGSGIGLATVDRIVKRHGGSIWAESSEGHGATFFFTLGSTEVGS